MVISFMSGLSQDSEVKYGMGSMIGSLCTYFSIFDTVLYIKVHRACLSECGKLKSYRTNFHKIVTDRRSDS